MANIEEFKQKYQLSDRNTYLLEPFVGGEVRILELSYPARERLKKYGQIAEAEFLAAAIVYEATVRLFYRLGGVLFSKDIPFNGVNPELAIFRDIVSYRAKSLLGPSLNIELPN